MSIESVGRKNADPISYKGDPKLIKVEIYLEAAPELNNTERAAKDLEKLLEQKIQETYKGGLIKPLLFLSSIQSSFRALW